MKIFVLDDDINRIKKIQNWFGDSISFAHDPEEAWNVLLSESGWDIIMLDHDLGGPYTRGPKGDGIDLARTLVESDFQCDCPIIIHSLNQSGAENIYYCLTKKFNRVFILPFTMLDKNDIIAIKNAEN